MSIRKLRELGVMIDCSRNAVVALPALKDFMKICAGMGYDFVGLYTEDTICVEDEPYFGYQRGRYTREEIREADAYAQSLGMELRPYIQTLAHINQIVDYEDYRGIIDVNDILLAKDPRTEELLDHLLKSVSESYSSRIVNIGMDEAHMIGLGKYLDTYGYEDRVEIILSHLDMVIRLCKKYGLRPQMWSDMFFRLLSDGAYDCDDEESSGILAEKMAQKVKIPEGLELVYWDYYSTDPSHYRRMLVQHKQMTSRISFAGGAWRWMGFAPYNGYSILATDAALSACLAEDVDSCVMTMWGDDGTECSIYAVLPVLMEAALAGGKIKDRESAEDLFVRLTGYDREDFMQLDRSNPGAIADKRNNLSKILLFNDPLLGIFDSLAPKNVSEYYSEAAAILGSISAQKEKPFAGIFRTQEALCLVLEKKADLGVVLRKAYQAGEKQKLKQIKDETLPEILMRLERFYTVFREQWMKENKSFGFEVQTVRIGGLIQRLKDIEKLLEKYLSGDISSIDELETKALPVGYAMDGAGVNEPEWNRYQKLVTTARLSW
ncbi:MAG: beta-N-acetylhexosaminidase [Lachnospiraceae bacterium]|nr:beta-N-acetylhexosaminidase [Lachnospiraceae bacterium]